MSQLQVTGGGGGTIIDPGNFLGSRGKRAGDDYEEGGEYIPSDPYFFRPYQEEDDEEAEATPAADDDIESAVKRMYTGGRPMSMNIGQGFPNHVYKRAPPNIMPRPLGSFQLQGKRGGGSSPLKVLRPNGSLLVGKRRLGGPNSSLMMMGGASKRGGGGGVFAGRPNSALIIKPGKRAARLGGPNSSLMMMGGKRKRAAVLGSRPNSALFIAPGKRAGSSFLRPSGNILLAVGRNKRARLMRPNSSLLLAKRDAGMEDDDELEFDDEEEDGVLVKREVEFFPVRGRREAEEI